jgi:hypothetical protein
MHKVRPHLQVTTSDARADRKPLPLALGFLAQVMDAGPTSGRPPANATMPSTRITIEFSKKSAII